MERFAAVEAEPFGARKPFIAETLEILGFGQPLQNRAFPAGGEIRVVAGLFDALLNPGFLLRILDMHEFDADIAAIGRPQQLEDLPERRALVTQHVMNIDLAIPIGIGKPISLRISSGCRSGACSFSGSSVACKWPRTR